MVVDVEGVVDEAVAVVEDAVVEAEVVAKAPDTGQTHRQNHSESCLLVGSVMKQQMMA